jgi:hypothetical protein
VERVGLVLRGLQGQANLRQRLAEARAIGRWPELVGSHLAGRTRPLRVADGRLFVLARGAALRQELTFHTATIVRKFNEAAGDRVVREVVFLEADALEGGAASSFSPAEAPAGAGRVAADSGAGTEPAGGDEEQPGESGADEETQQDVGAMYEVFDAEAYRRRLARIDAEPGGEPAERRES